jgi:A/G-specific adenine glycosylase
MDIPSLHHWFLKNKRDLPWRNHSDPYAIWISEIMLQQTQVATVIPYFIRWLGIFPNVRTLASAPLEVVLKMWEGLGYYSRARGLHEGARFIVDHFEGEIPSDPEQLKLIKGIGPYTMGAILSFAYHKKIPAVDGNVMRVLARYFKVEGDISKTATQKQIRSLVELLLPDNESWITNEALIELGATVCQPKARCQQCPLMKGCLSYKENLTNSLPFKSKKVTIESLYRDVAIIKWKDLYLVKKGESGKVMSDLYQFPFFEGTKIGMTSEEVKEKILSELQIKVEVIKPLADVSHSFTRYRVKLKPILFISKTAHPVDEFEWMELNQMKKLAFSSGHRRILESLE